MSRWSLSLHGGWPCRGRRWTGRKGVFDDQHVAYGSTPEQMLLDDSLEHRWVAVTIPGAFGVDDRDRPTFAHPQAVGFSAQDTTASRQAKLVEATLEILPGLQPAAPLTILGGRLIAAEENMTCGNVDTDTCRDSALTLSASGLGGVL